MKKYKQFFTEADEGSSVRGVISALAEFDKKLDAQADIVAAKLTEGCKMEEERTISIQEYVCIIIMALLPLPKVTTSAVHWAE